MQNQDQGEQDFITIHAGSADGKVLKMGVSINDYGEVRSLLHVTCYVSHVTCYV